MAKVLAPANRALLDLIAERRPASLDELAALSGRSKGNLSRTLRSMALYRIVALEPGPGRRLVPRVLATRFEIVLGRRVPDMSRRAA